MSTTFFPPSSAASETEGPPTGPTLGIVRFHVADYVVMVVMLVASLSIGAYFAFSGRNQKTTGEYFKGDRKMSMFPIVLSLMASFLSSNGMLGAPAETYMNGINFWFMVTGSIVAVPVAAYGFLPVFYDLQITSVYEYLQQRFNRKVRICGSSLAIATLIIHLSFVTYGPSLALSQVTGLSLWGSILATTIIASVYTSLGGIKAVLWTDAAQLLVFGTALFAAIIKGIVDVGGFSFIIAKAYEGNRITPLSFDFDLTMRFTFWSCFVAGILRWLNIYGINQIQVQRYLCCPTKQAARKSLWLNYPGITCVITLYCFLGLVLYANYWDCDPMRSGQIKQEDQIFPLFVMHVMRSFPGLPGLFVAGVYSASLSTISSELNSLAAITLQDYVRPCWKSITEEKATKVSKFIALGYGGVCLLMVVAISNLGSIIQTSSYLVGGSQGANLGLFTLGLLIPFSNSKGSLTGMACGLAMAWWISIGNQVSQPYYPSLPFSTEGCNQTMGDWTPYIPQPKSKNVFILYRISYFWIIPIGWIITVIVGCLASILTGGLKQKTDPKLISPLTRYFVKKLRSRKRNVHDDSVSSESMKTHPPSYDDCIEVPMLTPSEKLNSENSH